MSFRNSNRSQFWDCPKCGVVTEHRIPDCDSRWVTIDGTRVFERWRRCKTCASNLRTCELPAAEVNRMICELDQLRALKTDHRRLVAAMKARQEAEQVIQSFLPKLDVEQSKADASHVR